MRNIPKKPTVEEFQNYDGLHCHQICKEVGDNFRCPSCHRTKFEMLRWTKRNSNKPNSFYGWVATLHRHHDHSGNLLDPNSGRFPETIICGQCNASDGSAKKGLNWHAIFPSPPQK